MNQHVSMVNWWCLFNCSHFKWKHASFFHVHIC